jgi:hypothetical protein
MNTFCTIITSGHLPYAFALYKSLARYDPAVQLQVLVTDKNISRAESTGPHTGIQFFFAGSLQHYDLINELHSKYAHTSMDHFRWSLKPVFMCYLLENGFEKVLYVDADIFFYHAFEFLFDELDSAAVLLTPHWSISDPLINEESFITLFTCGIYNAGFVGASQAGLPALHWWSRACHYRMGAFASRGIYDDQRYLDLLPAEFENVHIIRHRGCNVAIWNQEKCRRVPVDNNILINGIYPVIFIHMSQVMVKEILKGHDALLKPYLDDYLDTFEQEGARLDDFIKDLDHYTDAGRLMKLKWQLKLRTRFKSFLFRLAEKI